jgi:hypothetical protein
MPDTDSTLRPGASQVPGQFLGYGLQYSRMLFVLLEHPEDAIVSLEVFEDVGAESGGKVLASQSKSSTTSNPISNRAVPLWKSFASWMTAITKGQLSTKNTIFELYVFGNFEGEICALFSKAASESDAMQAIASAKQLLKADKSPLPDHITRVLDLDPLQLVPLIVQFRYNHGSGNSAEDLRAKFRQTLIPEEYIEKVLIHALGWVKQQVDTLLEQSKPATIAVKDFRKEIAAYTRGIAFSDCLADMAGPARPEDVETHRSKHYVLQLELISLINDRILQAISAYLRSSVNRAEWGRLAIVHENGFDDFENRLIEFWKNSRTQCEIALSGKSKIQMGQYLLSECLKLNSPLQGRPVPYDFVEGCYHALADDLLLGWHPDFEKLTNSWK